MAKFTKHSWLRFHLQLQPSNVDNSHICIRQKLFVLDCNFKKVLNNFCSSKIGQVTTFGLLQHWKISGVIFVPITIKLFYAKTSTSVQLSIIKILYCLEINNLCCWSKSMSEWMMRQLFEDDQSFAKKSWRHFIFSWCEFRSQY